MRLSCEIVVELMVSSSPKISFFSRSASASLGAAAQKSCFQKIDHRGDGVDVVPVAAIGEEVFLGLLRVARGDLERLLENHEIRPEPLPELAQLSPHERAFSDDV